MRILIVLFALLLATPAFAQGWTVYENARFGATADIPPGFAPMGPEATNSDGLIFRSHQGGALLTIYGANVPSKNFEAYIEGQKSHDTSYNGWNIGDSSVTPRWAEYSGSLGGRQLRVRTITACDGKHALTAKLEFNGSLGSTEARVFRSLTEGAAKACYPRT
jgi:hypothetical protein